jgi:transcriptional regulator with XRE-family HTH domain
VKPKFPQGVRLREERRKRGFSLREVADRIEIDRTTLSLWERGRNIPRADVLAAWAKVFGLTSDDVLNKSIIGVGLTNPTTRPVD